MFQNAARANSAPLNDPDQSTFYVPGEHGYTDYPTLASAAHATT
jgi:N-ethylmaleimide reductase